VTILHLVQKPQLRGAELFTAQMATHTRRNGHRTIMVFLYNGEAQLPFRGKKICLNSSKQRRYIDWAAWRTLAGIIKKEQPDIIQCNAGDTLKYAVLSKLIFRWKQPLIFRNASTISLYIKNKYTLLWNSFFFGFTRKIVSVSNTSAADFARLYPRLRNKIVTIPVGIEENTMMENKKALSGVEGGVVEAPVFVHVGGFTYEKNHIRLINIFERICMHTPSAKLHLVGDGPLRKDIEATVRQKGLEDKITFYGSRNDAWQFIYRANVLLLPSVIEGLPAVIPEAFFCRTPVVAYDVGGIKELVINNKTGWLVAPGDEEGFVKAALSAVASNTLNDELVENAYRLVKSEYMNGRLANRFIKVYRSVIKDQ
jgi:glycosyltransferase involved in cell wall biosynthesis